MLSHRCFFVFALAPVIWAQSFEEDSLVDEEGSSFVQLSIDKNWNRGKVKDAEDMLDEMSFMQTRVENEHRVKTAPAGHSYEVHHMAAGVSPEGDIDVVEEGMDSYRDRPSLVLEDSFSLIQTKAHVVDPDDIPKVSLLQTSVQIEGKSLSTELSADDIAETWAEATTAALLASPDVPPAPSTVDSIKAGIAAPSAANKDIISTLENGVLAAWQVRKWIWFFFCLLVMQIVVWRKSHTNSKGLKVLGTAPASAAPKVLSLTLPLRQFLDPNVDSVKISRSADGLFFVAKLLEDANGERTVQLADASDPTEALLSIGPLPRSGLPADHQGAAVHHHSSGCTLGSLKCTYPGQWSIFKDGQAKVCISSSAPFTLAISSNEREVAWCKPLSGAKEPDYVDLCFCEGDPMLNVACTLAVLVASASKEEASISSEEAAIEAVADEEEEF